MNCVKLFHPQLSQLLLNGIFHKLMLLQIILVPFIKQNLFAMTLLHLFRSSFIWSHSTRTITLHIKADLGCKKFKLIQEEVQRLIGIHYKSVIRLYAIKLTLP